MYKLYKQIPLALQLVLHSSLNM